VVVDTNVLISGTIVSAGSSARILDAALDRDLKQIHGVHILTPRDFVTQVLKEPLL